MYMSTRLLGHLSREISHGNALWALLVGNEYFSSENPIRRALVAKALAHLESDSRDHELQTAIKEIALGTRLNELPETFKIRVTSLQPVKQGLRQTTTPQARKSGSRADYNTRRKPPERPQRNQSSTNPRSFLKSKILSYARVNSMKAEEVSIPVLCVKSG